MHTPQNSANSAQNGALSAQEQLLNGTLKLDPENDPVVFTTDYGLEIKWHMVGLPQDPSNISTLSSGKFTGYAYINAGGCNWVIIGRSNKTESYATGTLHLSNVVSLYYNYSNFDANSIWDFFANGQSTIAGKAIWNEYLNGKDVIYNTYSGSISQKAVFPNAVASSELEINEVLCFCQTYLPNTTTLFNSSNAGAGYNGSLLQSCIESFYQSSAEMLSLPIVPQTLITAGYNSATSTMSDAYLFPLAAQSSAESFYALTYLTAGQNTNMDIDVNWWLRSGSPSNRGYASAVNGAGNIVTNSGANYSYYTHTYYVRPAFVLQL